MAMVNSVTIDAQPNGGCLAGSNRIDHSERYRHFALIAVDGCPRIHFSLIPGGNSANLLLIGPGGHAFRIT